MRPTLDSERDNMADQLMNQQDVQDVLVYLKLQGNHTGKRTVELMYSAIIKLNERVIKLESEKDNEQRSSNNKKTK